MKKFVVIFWRVNPQFKDGGYYTDRMIEARTISSARKKAEKMASSCAYGGYEMRDLYEMKGEQA